MGQWNPDLPPVLTPCCLCFPAAESQVSLVQERKQQHAVRLDKAGVVSLLKGTEWVLRELGGWRPCLLACSLGPGSRWMCSLGARLSVPETQCPTGGPLRFWFPDYPRVYW